MNKLIVAQVNPNMADTAPKGVKKYQITFLQVFTLDLNTCLKLQSTGTRQFYTQFGKDNKNKTTTI